MEKWVFRDQQIGRQRSVKKKQSSIRLEMFPRRSVQSIILNYATGSVLPSLMLNSPSPGLPCPHQLPCPLMSCLWGTNGMHYFTASSIPLWKWFLWWCMCSTLLVLHLWLKHPVEVFPPKKFPLTSRCFLTDCLRWGTTALPPRAAGWWKSSTLLCPPKASCITLFVSAGWPETKAMGSPQESSTSWMQTALTLASR